MKVSSLHIWPTNTWQGSQEHSMGNRCVCMLSHFSHIQLCDSVDCNPPGSFIHGIIQARILEWVAMCASWESSRPRDRTCNSNIFCIADRFFTHWATWVAWGKDGLFNKWWWKNSTFTWKEWNWTPVLHHSQKLTQNGLRISVEDLKTKFMEESRGEKLDIVLSSDFLCDTKSASTENGPTELAHGQKKRSAKGRGSLHKARGGALNTQQQVRP